MAKKPETLFKERVQRDLERVPKLWFTKVQQVVIQGTPDFLICANGLFIGLELKIPSGKLSELQKFNLDRIEKSGGLSFVAMPDTWEEILDDIISLTE